MSQHFEARSLLEIIHGNLHRDGGPLVSVEHGQGQFALIDTEFQLKLELLLKTIRKMSEYRHSRRQPRTGLKKLRTQAGQGLSVLSKTGQIEPIFLSSDRSQSHIHEKAFMWPALGRGKLLPRDPSSQMEGCE
jgi:hypothetical protein